MQKWGMPANPSLEEFADVLAEIDSGLDYLETLQQMPFYEAGVAQQEDLHALVVGLHTSYMTIHEHGGTLLKSRRAGHLSDGDWQGSWAKITEALPNLRLNMGEIKKAIDLQRQADGLPAVGSDRPLN